MHFTSSLLTFALLNPMPAGLPSPTDQAQPAGFAEGRWSSAWLLLLTVAGIPTLLVLQQSTQVVQRGMHTQQLVQLQPQDCFTVSCIISNTSADKIYSNLPDFGVGKEKKISMTNSQTPGSNALPGVAYVYAKIHKEMSLQHMNDDKHSKWDCTSSIIAQAEIGFTYINKSNKTTQSLTLNYSGMT